jgi:predicted DNA-binding transcriptional regulator AlpA
MVRTRIAEPGVASNEFLKRRYLCEREVAAMLGLSTKTLQSWRLFGKGPRYWKLCGAVRYDVTDLEAWLKSCPVGGGER